MPAIKLWCSFFLVGISFGAGPCLASCGPLLVSYTAAAKKSWVAAAGTYLLFSLGRILAYLAVAEAVFFFGRMVSPDEMGWAYKYLEFGGGMFIAALGALMLVKPASEHGWCAKAQNLFLAHDAKTVVVLGVATGSLPCAPFLAVVSYIGIMVRDLLDAFNFSLAFGLGTAVSPLLVMAAVCGLMPKLFARKARWYAVFKGACALLIVLLGLNLMRRALL